MFHSRNMCTCILQHKRHSYIISDIPLTYCITSRHSWYVSIDLHQLGFDNTISHGTGYFATFTTRMSSKMNIELQRNIFMLTDLRNGSHSSRRTLVTIGSANGLCDKSLPEPMIVYEYLWATLTKAFHTDTIFCQIVLLHLTNMFGYKSSL